MTAGPVGFVGLGVMGRPMALNLARAGVDLVVWNRTPERAEPLRDVGAAVAASVDEVFARAATVLVMLVDETVTDHVLGRGGPDFDRRVAGHLVVSTGSVSPGYSRGLAADVRTTGGRFVESPVSGSRGPAEAGTLVAFLGGEADDADQARALMAPMTKAAIWCGPPGTGSLMKLAVNLYLNVLVAGLAEATHLAGASGLDLRLFRQAVLAGPMASDVAAAKLQQLVEHDFDVRAATADAYASTRLVAGAARDAGVASPLLDVASTLYGEAVDQGHGRRDMIAVIEAIRARS